MIDPLDTVRITDNRVEPDPAFRARIMDRLESELSSDDDLLSILPAPDDVVRDLEAIPLMSPSDVDDRHVGRHRAIIAIVSAAAAIAAIVLVMNRDPDRSSPAVVDQPVVTLVRSVGTQTTSSTTVAPTTTVVVFDPVGDAVIAESLLLDASAYGDSWIEIDHKDVVLDRSLATQVPACADYLDAVFESPDRQAVTTWRHVFHPAPALFGQYVVVLPTEQAAQAMFDAVADPTFTSDCLAPYYELTDEFGGYCCDPAEPGTPPMSGEITPTGDTFGADDLVTRSFTGTYINDQGIESDPETSTNAVIRVGRTINIIEAPVSGDTGLVTQAEFDTMIATAVELANTALT